ncbi:MAG: CO dehydrogenase/acetyl-CoA synthase gamma subunit (corrinoid Fe-S protein)-like protein [Dehalococcoidia bacterium]|nr:CO dehydrogenase/acetyl-CoA synthase gamma subunit (corrinoid Fe-S protein)-like protein [Dehalococcoidia bacterium]
MSHANISRKSPSRITGSLETVAGNIPQISTKLTLMDILGFWRMRWGIGRMNYKVEPGLYAIGSPGPDSPVLVSANYKMSFDILRRAVSSHNAWVFVIDTKGVNVWCAAGKGTFSTGAVLWQIKLTGLQKIAPHGTIILPQLSATGVKAHEVQKISGLRTVFGPVRADDIPAFLDNGMKATAEMRKVKFGMIDRLVLTPVEIKSAFRYLILLLFILFILGGVSLVGFSVDKAWSMFVSGGVALLGAVLTGTVITPMLLPWVPGRAFSLKGGQVGLAWALAVSAYNWNFLSEVGLPGITNRIAALLAIPAISAYLAFNFTGSTTYTSMSGVRKEMRLALPLILGAGIVGILVFLVGLVKG